MLVSEIGDVRVRGKRFLLASQIQGRASPTATSFMWYLERSCSNIHQVDTGRTPGWPPRFDYASTA